MSNAILESIVKEKDFTFKRLLYKIVKDYHLEINELLLIIYFLNQEKPFFDVNLIEKVTFLSSKDILTAFSSITNKGLISMNVIRDKTGNIEEIIDLKNIYKAMVSDINTNIKAEVSENIFTIFEKEFGRTLSPIEFEIINAWLKSGVAEELILGALQEATYNGVSNLRYIDKIIHEWSKKGFKAMTDVKGHLRKKETKEKSPILFDYNWLDDDD